MKTCPFAFHVRAEIAQLFKCTPLFQRFIILDLYLEHMESLTEIVGRQAISAPTFPIIWKLS